MIGKEIWSKVRRIQVRTCRAVTDAFAGAYQSAFKGRGMQFADVREYQPGDDVRAIDWNVTARMQLPYVKRFQEERELTVMLVVDVSPSCLFGSQGVSKQERVTEIASVLALSATRNQDRVGLLLFTDRVEAFIPPAKASAHVMRLIRGLLTVQPEGKGTDIGVALRHLFRVQPRRGVCFLLSDFLSKPCEQAVAVAARQYDLTTICLTDRAELDFPKVGLLRVKDLETGVFITVDSSHPKVRDHLKRSTQERIDAVRKVTRRCGASFIDLRAQDDYVAQLQQAFEEKEKASR
jgi:uncharacterized protein (DUF58 family)